MGVCTGTFQDAVGSPIASGLYQWKLSSDAINVSTTAACVVPRLITGILDTSGNMTATFAFNDVLTTASGVPTTYQLTVKDKNGGQVWNESYFLSGSTANINSIPPNGSQGGVFIVLSSVVALGNTSGSPNITMSNYIVLVTMTLTGATTPTFTTTNLPAGALVIFTITQDASGNRAFTWPASVVNGMSMIGTANQSAFQIFQWDGSKLNALSPGMFNP